MPPAWAQTIVFGDYAEASFRKILNSEGISHRPSGTETFIGLYPRTASAAADLSWAIIRRPLRGGIRGMRFRPCCMPFQR